EVRSAGGVPGLGSVFTSLRLVEGSVEILRPFLIGASALDPAAVSERLHQATFWQGRGGAVTHTISGIDIALWDILGQVTRQPIGRLRGGRYCEKVRPYASVLMQEAQPLADRLRAIQAQGFRAFKIGWGPFGQDSHKRDEAIVRAAREAIGPDALLMVDAGASNAFWPRGYKWALRTADMLAAHEVAWFEEPLLP